MVRLCYPINIMTATNWNKLQIYPCKKQAGGTFMLSNRHHRLQIGITYRSTHVKSRKVERLCYPFDIMTDTNLHNLQIYPCKKQAGGTFMLSNRHQQVQIGITYRSTHVKSRQVVHLC